MLVEAVSEVIPMLVVVRRVVIPLVVIVMPVPIRNQALAARMIVQLLLLCR
jgi:hypothetical protein